MKVYLMGKLKESLLDKRDTTSANSIVTLIQRDDVPDLLVAVGRMHLEGVIEQLGKTMEMKEQ